MVTDHTDTQLMDIMERDLLMLSQRLMLTIDTVLDTALLDMVTDHTDTQLMDIMERDPLMLSQRLMLTMGYGYRSYGYPAYGYYGKRSADAEPEADAYYGYGLGYSTLGYGYRSYGYGYPSAYGYYGKRSADAEPKADAYYGV